MFQDVGGRLSHNNSTTTHTLDFEKLICQGEGIWALVVVVVVVWGLNVGKGKTLALTAVQLSVILRPLSTMDRFKSALGHGLFHVCGCPDSRSHTPP